MSRTYTTAMVQKRQARAQKFLEKPPTTQADKAALHRLRTSRHVDTATNFFVRIGSILQQGGTMAQVQDAYNVAINAFQQPFGCLLGSNRVSYDAVIQMQELMTAEGKSTDD